MENRNLLINIKHITGGKKIGENNRNFFLNGEKKSLPYDFLRKVLNVLSRINYGQYI